MKNVADVTDNSGSWVRIDTIPGPDLDDPKLIMVTIKDESLATVHLTLSQAHDLIDGLQDAVWECT